MSLHRMSLHRYFHPSCLGLSSLRGRVPPSVVASVSEELEKLKGTKVRGSYLKFTAEEKATVAKYASLHGVKATRVHFSKEWEKELKETTIRDWLAAYRKELERKRRCPDEGDSGEPVVCALPQKKRGRPLLLGEKIDSEVQLILKNMREHGGIVNSAIVMSTATGVLKKRNPSVLNCNGGPIDVSKDWAKSLLF